MQLYEPASFYMLRHQYDSPTFKTNMLHLASNEERPKHLLLLYKRCKILIININHERYNNIQHVLQ